jgi:hypothetical protein
LGAAIGQERLETARKRKKEQHYSFAASTATTEQQELAKSGIQPDGTKAVQCQKRTWRPQVKYDYQEIPTELDPSDDWDWLLEKHGKCMAKKKTKLPKREGVLPYDPAKHAKVIKEGIQWKDCPEDHRPIIERIIQDTWDPFNPETMQTAIRGYEFVIDTGTHEPVCCKPP